METTSSWAFQGEARFWEQHFTKKTEEDPDFLDKVLSPERQLSGFAEDVLDRSRTGREVKRILDVGCGPISVLGWKSRSHTIELSCADPLALMYNDILARFGQTPPYEVAPCGGEDLLVHYTRDSFDYVYSRNAIDHAFDAPLSVRNMYEVAAKGGVIELHVFENEGLAANYSGLHRWNFQKIGDQVIIWNRNHVQFLDHAVEGAPYIVSRVYLDHIDRYMLQIRVYKSWDDWTELHEVDSPRIQVRANLDLGIFRIDGELDGGEYLTFVNVWGPSVGTSGFSSSTVNNAANSISVCSNFSGLKRAVVGQYKLNDTGEMVFRWKLNIGPY